MDCKLSKFFLIKVGFLSFPVSHWYMYLLYQQKIHVHFREINNGKKKDGEKKIKENLNFVTFSLFWLLVVIVYHINGSGHFCCCCFNSQVTAYRFFSGSKTNEWNKAHEIKKMKQCVIDLFMYYVLYNRITDELSKSF